MLVTKYKQGEYTTKIIYVQPTRNAAPSADVAASGANSAVPFPNQIKVAWRPPNKPLLSVKQVFGAMACSPMPLIHAAATTTNAWMRDRATQPLRLTIQVIGALQEVLRVAVQVVQCRRDTARRVGDGNVEIRSRASPVLARMWMPPL